MSKRWRIALLTAVAWTLIGLYFATQAYYNPAYEPGSMSWSRALIINFTYYYLWGLSTPLVIWLGRRFRFDTGKWGRALFAHAIAGILITAAQIFVAELLLAWIALPMRSGSFLDRIAFSFGVNFQSSLPTYWLILFAWYAFDYYAKFRDRELRAAQLETQLSRAQLQALKMQLNPHFLFNTLNSISSLMYTDVETADAMLARLSEFLRLTLDGELDQEITLAQELEFVRRYLEIEQIRFEDRLRVQLDIAAGAEEATVPSLALQPLIENAIHHGIAPRPAGGSIAIKARRENGHLHISIADDGIGISSRRERVGLANTRARLEQLYGKAQQLTISDSPGGGCMVDIVIPFRSCGPSAQ